MTRPLAVTETGIFQHPDLINVYFLPHPFKCYLLAWYKTDIPKQTPNDPEWFISLSGSRVNYWSLASSVMQKPLLINKCCLPVSRMWSIRESCGLPLHVNLWVVVITWNFFYFISSPVHYSFGWVSEVICIHFLCDLHCPCYHSKHSCSINIITFCSNQC